MNPFDLPGPQFLLFYIILGSALAGFLWIHRHHSERDKAVSAPELTDPYLVAYLRAGAAEVWRLATIRLIDLGLMRAEGPTIRTEAETKPDDVQNEVERATLAWFRKPQAAISLIQESSSFQLRQVVLPYEERLIELGLLPDEESRNRSRLRYAGAAFLLGVVAATKIIVALDRGHQNVAFLIVLACVAIFTLHKLAIPARTRRGHAVIEDLRKLFSRLHQPGLLEPGKSSAEVMWMAAVYGVSALTFGHVKELYPKAYQNTSCGGCGSSCGSSCGGGGCGGGCGGCGG